MSFERCKPADRAGQNGSAQASEHSEETGWVAAKTGPVQRPAEKQYASSVQQGSLSCRRTDTSAREQWGMTLRDWDFPE